jgi:hypothetical protein
MLELELGRLKEDQRWEIGSAISSLFALNSAKAKHICFQHPRLTTHRHNLSLLLFLQAIRQHSGHHRLAGSTGSDNLSSEMALALVVW